MKIIEILKVVGLFLIAIALFYVAFTLNSNGDSISRGLYEIDKSIGSNADKLHSIEGELRMHR